MNFKSLILIASIICTSSAFAKQRMNLEYTFQLNDIYTQVDPSLLAGESRTVSGNLIVKTSDEKKHTLEILPATTYLETVMLVFKSESSVTIYENTIHEYPIQFDLDSSGNIEKFVVSGRSTGVNMPLPLQHIKTGILEYLKKGNVTILKLDAIADNYTCGTISAQKVSCDTSLKLILDVERPYYKNDLTGEKY
ncbi:MAG: hypothetical protein KDD38_00635 [Bdellovibrionales bacterium]|nr:hypothetical protein [Bdellovibrionales bacterium]